MSKFEILCVTMHQNDFSKLKEMNVHSDIVYANQCDCTSYEELAFEGHVAKMISTQTRGVGTNRNLALLYASADICLFADDDVTYVDELEDIVTSEFEKHPDADVFIFHLDTDSQRKQVKYSKTRKCGRFERMPWATFRVAVRLSAVRKANVWFTTLFGGGCVFPSGEDSMWLSNAKKSGLTFYVSEKTIGSVSFEQSTWFTGYNEKFFYGNGAWCAANHQKTFGFWTLYYLWRYRNRGNLSLKEKKKWMKHGRNGYRQMISFKDYISKNQLEI